MTYASGNPILASDFNSLKDTFNVLWGPRTSFDRMPDWAYYISGAYDANGQRVLNPSAHPTNGPRGYGQTLIPAAIPGEIKASDWATLIDNLKATLEHQGTAYTPMTTPTKGGVITANPSVVTANFNLANSIDNIYSGSIATADLYTGTSPLSFNTIHHIDGVVDFGSRASLSNFIAAGGQIDLYATTPGPLSPVTQSLGRIRLPGAGYGSAARSQKIDGVVYTGMSYISGAPTRADNIYNLWNMTSAAGETLSFAQQFYTTSSGPGIQNTGGPIYGYCYLIYNHPSNGRITYTCRLGYDRFEAARTPGVNGVDTPAGTTFNIVIRNPTTSALFKKTWNTPTVSFAYTKDPDFSWEPTQVQIANYFWNYRNRLVKLPGAPEYSYYPPVDGSYPGASGGGTSFAGIANYENFYHNNYNFRYTQGRQTNNWTFSLTDLPKISSYVTTLSLISGAIASGDGQSIHGIINSGVSPVSVVLNSQRNWAWADNYGVGFRRQTYQADIGNISSGYIEGSSFYTNGGAWQYMLLFPGRLKYTDLALDFNPNTYSVNVGPGEFHICIVERGGNGRQEIPPPSWPAQSAFKVISVDHWWYNGADLQIAVNTTSSTQNFTWRGPNDAYGNPTTAFPGGTGHTPRYAFKMVAE